MQDEIAARILGSQKTVSRHLKKIRAERRENRNVEARHFPDQLDQVKREQWREAGDPAYAAGVRDAIKQ